jgi:hypothetical protein
VDWSTNNVVRRATPPCAPDAETTMIVVKTANDTTNHRAGCRAALVPVLLSCASHADPRPAIVLSPEASTIVGPLQGVYKRGAAGDERSSRSLRGTVRHGDGTRHLPLLRVDASN